MSKQTEELVQNSYTKANYIVEETNNQKKVSSAIVETFDSVKIIADELFDLSKLKKR